MSTGYRLVENARLDARNTFGVAARAPMLVEVSDTSALAELFGYAMLRDGPVLVLGGGSNLVLSDDFDGLVLHMSIPGRALVAEDADAWYVRAGAGEHWHDFVQWTLVQGWP